MIPLLIYPLAIVAGVGLKKFEDSQAKKRFSQPTGKENLQNIISHILTQTEKNNIANDAKRINDSFDSAISEAKQKIKQTLALNTAISAINKARYYSLADNFISNTVHNQYAKDLKIYAAYSYTKNLLDNGFIEDSFLLVKQFCINNNIPFTVNTSQEALKEFFKIASKLIL